MLKNKINSLINKFREEKPITFENLVIAFFYPIVAPINFLLVSYYEGIPWAIAQEKENWQNVVEVYRNRKEWLFKK